MKKYCLILLFLALNFQFLQAQIKLSGTVSAFAVDMEKIVRDFPNGFKNIMGDLIVENPQSADYTSKIKPAGSLECSITRYSSLSKEISSWQALLFVSTEFLQIEKKFKSFYNQLNNLSVRFDDGRQCKFKGEYEKPTEEKRFFHVIFTPATSDKNLMHLKMELMMAYEMMEWRINVLVYESERNDDERGRVIEF